MAKLRCWSILAHVEQSNKVDDEFDLKKKESDEVDDEFDLKKKARGDTKKTHAK